MDENSIDAIVTDPPYHLTTGKKGGTGEASLNLDSPAGRARVTTGFMGMKWDGGDIAHNVEMWAGCLRVLKPGGYLLSFGGSRTYHRMVCAIEDAGFEIRDQIMYLYGSGFPKSLDVSKAIDKAAGAEREVLGVSPNWRESKRDREKFGSMEVRGENAGLLTGPAVTNAAQQWSGFGTALKPAHEPICVARKPLEGTVAANVLKWGTGAINIDGCRVHADDAKGYAYSVTRLKPGATLNKTGGNWRPEEGGVEYQGHTQDGRWPANLIHDGSDEVLAAFPQAPGQLADASTSAPSARTKNCYGKMNREGEATVDKRYTEEGSTNFAALPGQRRFDQGSAARFFYTAKTSKSERGEGNGHPCVKPQALMRYLCRLVTPPGGVVLDPFMGSGSTGLAAMKEGFDFIGIELSADYIKIAEARILAEILK